MVTSSTPKFKVGLELKRASRINLRDLTKDIRFEASAYGLKCKKAQDELRATGHQLKAVYGEGGLARESHNAFQFARCYVSSEFGVPFMGSSDIIFVDFRPTKFLSRKNTKRLEQLMIQPWDVLLSCSGTVGNVALAPPSWNSIALSQHVLRIRFDDSIMAGFIAAFLRSPWGRAQTVGLSYGSVISHIEPQHLERVLVPLLPPEAIKTVGTAFCRAAEERAEANRLLREAEGMFETELSLRSRELTSKGSIIRLSELNMRFQGSYHAPRPRTIRENLSKARVTVLSLKDFNIGGEVRAVTKFRSRVNAKIGIPFVSSKELFQIAPIGSDYLAPNIHAEDMGEIGLIPYELAISCYGTLGRVMLMPEYVKGWAGNQAFMRVSGNKSELAYICAWLGSPSGQELLLSEAFGSIVTYLDKSIVEKFPIPIFEADKREVISRKVLRATELRESAWKSEQDALALLSTSIKRVPEVPNQPA